MRPLVWGRLSSGESCPRHCLSVWGAGTGEPAEVGEPLGARHGWPQWAPCKLPPGCQACRGSFIGLGAGPCGNETLSAEVCPTCLSDGRWRAVKRATARGRHCVCCLELAGLRGHCRPAGHSSSRTSPLRALVTELSPPSPSWCTELPSFDLGSGCHWRVLCFHNVCGCSDFPPHTLPHPRPSPERSLPSQALGQCPVSSCVADTHVSKR